MRYCPLASICSEAGVSGCSVAVHDIDDAAVFDEHSLIATNRVHSVNDRDVAVIARSTDSGASCAQPAHERGAECEGGED